MFQLYELDRELHPVCKHQVCTSPALPPSQHAQHCVGMTTAQVLVFAHELQRPVAGALQKRCADAAPSLARQQNCASRQPSLIMRGLFSAESATVSSL